VPLLDKNGPTKLCQIWHMNIPEGEPEALYLWSGKIYSRGVIPLCWTGKWIGMVEWTMEWTMEFTFFIAIPNSTV